MPDQSRLQRLSETLYWTTLVLSVVLPLIVLYYAGKGVADPGSLLTQAPVLPADLVVTRAQAGLVAAVAIASVLPMLAALRAMTRLFDRYRMGEVLSHANATTILTIGRALLAVAAFTIAVPTLHALILSWNAPQRVLSIALDSGTLGFAIAAGLLTVIGWAMAEAARIKAENEGFV
jgi:mannose/fructose/N-acetylgalactosamine-specific phosphotransferase system component IIC